MQPILPTKNVPVTNANGPHGEDDPANMPAAIHKHMPPGEATNPMNLNHLHWRKPGSPGGS